MSRINECESETSISRMESVTLVKNLSQIYNNIKMDYSECTELLKVQSIKIMYEKLIPVVKNGYAEILMQNFKSLDSFLFNGAILLTNSIDGILVMCEEKRRVEMLMGLFDTSSPHYWHFTDLLAALVKTDQAVGHLHLLARGSIVDQVIICFVTIKIYSTSTDCEKMQTLFYRISCLIIDLLAIPNCTNALALCENKSLFILLDEVIRMGDFGDKIHFCWIQYAMDIIDTFFSHLTDNYFYEELCNYKILERLIHGVGIFMCDYEKCDRLIHLIRVILETSITIPRSSNVITAFGFTFQTKNGYKILLDLFFFNEATYEQEKQTLMNHKILDIFVFAMYHFVAPSQIQDGELYHTANKSLDSYIFANPEDTYDIILNTKVLNILALLFTDSKNADLHLMIAVNFLKSIQHNFINYNIINDHGIFQSFFAESVKKSCSVHKVICQLLSYTISHNIITRNAADLSFLTLLLSTSPIQFTDMILSVILDHISFTHFITKFSQSDCIVVLLDLFQKYLVYKDDEEESICVKVCKILTVVDKTNQKNNSPDLNHDRLLDLVATNILLYPNNHILIQTFTYLIGVNDARINEFLCESLYHLINSNQHSLIVIILNIMISTYKDEHIDMEVVLSYQTISPITNCLICLQKWLYDDFEYPVLSDSLICSIRIMLQLLSLIACVTKYANETRISFASLFNQKDYESIFISLKHFRCFSTLPSDPNACGYANYLIRLILGRLISISIGSQEAFNNSFNGNVNKFPRLDSISDCIILHPMFVAIMIQLFGILYDLVRKSTDSAHTYINEILTETMNFIFKAIQSSKYNQERLSEDSCVNIIFKVLFPLWKTKEPVPFGATIKHILIVLVSRNCTPQILLHILESNVRILPYNLMSNLIKYKYKTLIWCHSKDQETVFPNQIEHMQLVESKNILTRTKNRQQSLKQTDPLPEEVTSMVPTTSVTEFKNSDVKDIMEILVSTKSGGTLSLGKNEGVEEIIEPEDVTTNTHYVEMLSESSDQWQNLKNILLQSLEIVVPVSYSDERKNFIISTDSIPTQLDEQPLKENVVVKDENLKNLLGFVKDMATIANSSFLSKSNTSFIEICTNANENAYIFLPHFISLDQLKQAKQNYSFNVFNPKLKSEFIYSIWFQVNDIYLEDKEDSAIFLLLLAQKVNSVDSFTYLNVLTVAYYPNWQTFVVSTEARRIFDLNLIDRVNNNKYRKVFSRDIKNGTWYNVTIRLKAPFIPGASHSCKFLLDGKQIENFKLSFPSSQDTNEDLYGFIGSFPQNLSTHNRKYKLGIIYSAIHELSEDKIQAIIADGPDGTQRLPNSTILDDKLQKSKLMYDPKTLMMNSNFILFLNPNDMNSCKFILNEDIFVKEAQVCRSLCSGLEKRVIPLNNLIPIQNNVSSLSELNVYNSHINILYFLNSTSPENIVIQKKQIMTQSLFRLAGFNIFILLIEKCSDSDGLFNSIDIFFDLLDNDFAFSKIFFNSSIIDILPSIMRSKKSLLNLQIFKRFNKAVSDGFLCHHQTHYLDTCLKLLFDFDIWMGIHDEIDFMLLSRVDAFVFNKSTYNNELWSVTQDYILQKIVQPLLYCVVKYALSQESFDIYINIIKTSLISAQNGQGFFESVLIFVLDLMATKSSFDVFKKDDMVIINNCNDFCLTIINFIYTRIITSDKPVCSTFADTAGIQYLALFFHKNVNKNFLQFVFKIFVFYIIQNVRNNADILKTEIQTKIIKELEDITRLHAKSNEKTTSITFKNLFYHISKPLAKSALSLQVVIHYLVSLLYNGTFNELDKKNFKPSMENALKYPMNEVRRFSQSNFYPNSTKNSPFPEFYFCSQASITIINFIAFRLKIYCKKYPENNKKYMKKIILCLFCLSHFLQVAYYSILSKIELVNACCTQRFMHGILYVLCLLKKYPFIKDEKYYYSSAYEFCYKVIVAIIDAAFKSFNSFTFSKPWAKTNSLDRCVQFILYRQVLLGFDEQTAHEIVFTTMNKLFDVFFYESTRFVELLKSSPVYIVVLSNMVHGQTVCFGGSFSVECFRHVVNICQLVFACLHDINYASQISLYTSSVGYYLFRSIAIPIDDIDVFANTILPISAIISANVHILFHHSNNANTEPFRNVFTAFLCQYYYLYAVVQNVQKEDDASKNSHLNALSKIYSLIQFIQVYNKKFLMECVFDIYNICLHKNWNESQKEDFIKFSEKEESIYCDTLSKWESIEEIKKLYDELLKKAHISIDNVENMSEKLITTRQKYYTNVKNWYQSMYSSINIKIKTSLLEQFNVKFAKDFFAFKELENIHESIYHDYGLLGATKNDPVQRWELVLSSGCFCISQRMRRNPHFYFNYLTKYKTEKNSNRNPKSEFCDIFKNDLSDAASIYSNLNFKDSAPFISFINKPIYINPIPLVKYKLNGVKVLKAFKIARVEKLDAIEGVIILSQTGLYIVDGLTITNGNLLIESFNVPNDCHIQNIHSHKVRFNDKSFFKYISYNNTLCIRSRRYLLMSIGFEIYDYDNFSYFLVFNKEDKKAFSKIFYEMMTSQKHLLVTQRIRNQTYQYFEPFICGLLDLQMDRVMSKWMNREIDNFQYLLYLNIRAGRNFCDYSQYPVFPWVLKDYTSPNLNLNNESSYRNFALPMGAQTEDRLKSYARRYNEWDSLTEKIPKFHYATFYSTSMSTCFYLVRMEPYSSSFIELQGGYFDLPDRMFSSVNEAWKSSSQTSMADVKELIPEFFYTHEFLTNHNKFIFGEKQNTSVVNDVNLPLWARNDPREFIRLNRAALESDYVSDNIHHWIDLIFGCKQTGKKAFDSYNLFHAWFYKGTVNVPKLSDKTIKDSIIAFINNFGQVPKKLFKAPHLRRKQKGSSIVEAYDWIYEKHEDVVLGICTESHPIPISEMVIFNSRVCYAYKYQILVPPYFYSKISFERFDGNIMLIEFKSTGKTEFSSVLDTTYHTRVTSACFINIKYLAMGTSEGTIIIWRYKSVPQFTIKFYKTLYASQSRISCLAASSHHKLLISGSDDGSVHVHDIIDFTHLRKIQINFNPILSISIIPSTCDIVVFQRQSISFYSANGAKLAYTNTNRRINCAITFNNPLHYEYQLIALGTERGVEIWKFGYEILSKPDADITSHDIPGGWVSFEPSSTTVYSDKRTIFESKIISIPLTENKTQSAITAIHFDSASQTIFVAVDSGKIYTITSKRNASEHRFKL